MRLLPRLTKRNRMILLVLGGVYVSLWLVTHLFGTAQVRTEVLHDYVNLIGKTEHRIVKDEDWCRTSAYAPFIVQAEYSFGLPMRGCGGTQIYFWIFGRTLKIWDLDYWVS